MELVLKGFEDYVLDILTNDKGSRWVDLYEKDEKGWQLLDTFTDMGSALDALIYEYLLMTEDDVCARQRREHGQTDCCFKAVP